MKVVSIRSGDASEPRWESVGMRGCDFRPHFDGDLVNLFTTVLPETTKQESASLFLEISVQIARWVLEERKRFSPGDKFQIIAGWPLEVRSTGRQVVKAGGSFEELRRLVEDPSLIHLRDGWDHGLFA